MPSGLRIAPVLPFRSVSLLLVVIHLTNLVKKNIFNLTPACTNTYI